jgi:hypothetical protein
MTVTVTQTFARSLALAALFAMSQAVGQASPGDDKPGAKDEALDSLLEKLDAPKAEQPPPPPKPAGEGAKAKKGETSAPAPKPPGDLSTKDKDLDGLLEKLGATGDTPAPDDRKAGPGGKGDEPPPPPGPGEVSKGKPGKEKKADPNALTGKARDLDEHLEELTGVRRKKKNRPDGDEGGPLSEVIKEMRDVEQRLGQPDTGEETRKKQARIVKQIDTLIEQMRNSGGRQQLRMRRMMAQRQGQRPGQQPGPTPGTTGGNAPTTKPLKPTTRHSTVNGKDEWGHLPPELRQEMDNVSKEMPLSSREELIELYYLSVAKQKLNREN